MSQQETMITKCKNCKKEFTRKLSQIKRSKFSFCSQKCYWSYLKTRLGKDTGNWKGDKVGYRAIHYWVESKLGKASKQSCKLLDNTCKGRKEWSNISGKYLRKLSDWQVLCQSHHWRKDRG